MAGSQGEWSQTPSGPPHRTDHRGLGLPPPSPLVLRVTKSMVTDLGHELGRPPHAWAMNARAPSLILRRSPRRLTCLRGFGSGGAFPTSEARDCTRTRRTRSLHRLRNWAKKCRASGMWHRQGWLCLGSINERSRVAIAILRRGSHLGTWLRVGGPLPRHQRLGPRPVGVPEARLRGQEHGSETLSS